jgi:hypothetical protein
LHLFVAVIMLMAIVVRVIVLGTMATVLFDRLLVLPGVVSLQAQRRRSQGCVDRRFDCGCCEWCSVMHQQSCRACSRLDGKNAWRRLQRDFHCGGKSRSSTQPWYIPADPPRRGGSEAQLMSLLSFCGDHMLRTCSVATFITRVTVEFRFGFGGEILYILPRLFRYRLNPPPQDNAAFNNLLQQWTQYVANDWDGCIPHHR